MKIGLIAGSGQFPLLFSRKAKRKGFSVYAVAYHHETDPELENHVEGMEWIYLGQINRLIRFFKKYKVDQAVMIGAIKKTRLFSDIKPDIKALSFIAGLKNSHDDGLLRTFSNILQKEGITVLASTFLLPELVAAPGRGPRRKPSRAEKRDIGLGWTLAKEIGRLDIGQCVVVGKGSVLAVEAIDGTDATIRRGGELGGGEAVVVKVSKPNQDLRFDMPAVGEQTIRIMAEVRATALAIEADRAVVFDREEMVKLADLNQITIVSMKNHQT